MSSEWMAVMLEEIARKKAESATSREESERRGEAADPNAPVPPGRPASPGDEA